MFLDKNLPYVLHLVWLMILVKPSYYFMLYLSLRGHGCLLFLKTVFCSKKPRRTRKIGNTCLFSFFSLENIKNIKFKEQRRVFIEHLFGVLCVFKNKPLDFKGIHFSFRFNNYLIVSYDG